MFTCMSLLSDCRNTRVNELEANLGQAKEDVLRLQTERTDLIAKVSRNSLLRGDWC